MVVTSPHGDMPVSCLNGIPSGNLLPNDGQYPCFMGKSTISMVIFNSYFDITRGDQCRKNIKFPDSHPRGADHRHPLPRSSSHGVALGFVGSDGDVHSVFLQSHSVFFSED